jgi:uncharacterized membrane protein
VKLMITTEIPGFIVLFCVGILAGMELVVYYGVRGPLASLEERPQTLMRQALIRRLRLLVPGFFLPAALSGFVVTLLSGFGTGFVFRLAGLVALLAWASVTIPGTVPINSAILSWDPGALPENWRELVSRWERFASVRPWAATFAFVLFLAGVAV